MLRMSKLSSEILKKVFVYGTLKRGEPNHHWLTSTDNGFSRFVDEGMTVEKFPLVIGTRYNIPFLLDKRGTGNNVNGEVYEVDEKMFANLDVLEDYPAYYDREIQTIVLKNKDETVQCWLYLIRQFPEKLMAKEHLISYQNTTENPYTERSARDVNIKAIDDLSYLDSNKDDMYEDEEAPPKPS